MKVMKQADKRRLGKSLPRLALAAVFALSLPSALQAQESVERLRTLAQKVRAMRRGVIMKPAKGPRVMKRVSRAAALRSIYRQMAAVQYKSLIKKGLPPAARAKVKASLQRLEDAGELAASDAAMPTSNLDANACGSEGGAAALGADVDGRCYYDATLSAGAPAMDMPMDTPMDKKMSKLQRYAEEAAREQASASKAGSSESEVASADEWGYLQGKISESMAEAATQPALPPVAIDAATGEADLDSVPSGSDVEPVISELESGEGEVTFAQTLPGGELSAANPMPRGAALKKAYLLAAAADVNAALLAGVPEEKHGEVDSTVKRMRRAAGPAAKSKKAARRGALGLADEAGVPESDPLPDGNSALGAMTGEASCDPTAASCVPACSEVDSEPLDAGSCSEPEMEGGEAEEEVQEESGQPVKVEGRFKNKRRKSGEKKGDILPRLCKITANMCDAAGNCRNMWSKICGDVNAVARDAVATTPAAPKCQPDKPGDPQLTCENGGTCDAQTNKCVCANSKSSGDRCENFCDSSSQCGPHGHCKGTNSCACDHPGWDPAADCKSCLTGFQTMRDSTVDESADEIAKNKCVPTAAQNQDQFPGYHDFSVCVQNYGNVSMCCAQAPGNFAVPQDQCFHRPQGRIVRGTKSGFRIYAVQAGAGKKAAGPFRKSARAMAFHRSISGVSRKLGEKKASRSEKAALLLKRAEMYVAMAEEIPPGALIPPPAPARKVSGSPPFSTPKPAPGPKAKRAKAASLPETEAAPEEAPEAPEAVTPAAPEEAPEPEETQAPELTEEPAPPAVEELRKRDTQELDDLEKESKQKIQRELDRRNQQSGDGR